MLEIFLLNQFPDVTFNPLHSYVECVFILVFISVSVPFDIVSVAAFFVEPVKEKQGSILEIVSRYIVRLKVRKYNNSGKKTGI